MATQDDNLKTKVIPSILSAVSKTRSEEKENRVIKKQEIALLFGAFVAYLILISVITFLPIILSLKIIGLLIGSFIIIDILQAFKRRIFE